MQLAAPRYLEHVGVVGVLDAQRDVAHVSHQALAQLAAGDELAFPPGERRGVDLEIHHEGGLVDLEQRQSLRMLGIGEGHADPMSSMPLTATMSPACASSVTTRSRPLNTSTWLTLDTTGALSGAVQHGRCPERMRPR